jgi:hypothetical protein
MGVIFGDHAVWHNFCMCLFSYVFCACVSVCTCFALFCHSCKNSTTVSVCTFFVTLQSLPAAVFSDWNFRLIALLHDLVNSPHVRQLPSQFLHTCFICSCFQLVMFASSFKNAQILEFSMSALYEAYVSMILVLNMPPSQFKKSPILLLVQSRVCFLALTVRKPFMMSLVILVWYWCTCWRVVVFSVGQFLCCVNL